MPLFIGLDLGTQGVRAIVSNENGNIFASESIKFDMQMISSPEQDTEVWRKSILKVLSAVSGQLGRSIRDIQSISVTSTSGTIVPINEKLEPIYNAIMYHNNVGISYLKKLTDGNLNKSFTFAKILWFQNERKKYMKDVYKFIHANDYLILLLTGTQIVSDYSSSLKSGYDVFNERWNDLGEVLKLSSLFPKVDKPGKIVGNLSKQISQETGLPQTIKVVLGMTDGCTGLLSTGCAKEGDWCTTIGTTMVIKGLSQEYVKDDVFYSHKHPDNLWMPGGASNIGAKWVSYHDFDKNIDYFNKYAYENLLAEQFHYPLIGKGERFPFQDQEVEGFDNTSTDEESFLAGMEGVAFIERMAYEKLETEYGVIIKNIFSAGSAGQNEVWNKIRSNVLKKPIIPAGNEGSAFGAAIIAASGTHFDNLTGASINMNQRNSNIVKDYSLSEQYDKRYYEFLKVLDKQRLKDKQ